MRRSLRLSILLITATIFSLVSYAQNVTIKGKVQNMMSKENVPAVSVTVKGSKQGSFTDDNGNFRIKVSSLPATLVISSVGFETKEVQVSSADETVQAYVVPASTLGQEIVVSATRSPERILESPVTVEKMSSTTIRNLPAPNYYEGISNMKGVDMHTASLTFRTVSTRGFVASGNTRFNQFIDGMDNQAPGLNFSVGNIIGLTELDVDNIELLSGASSALYGSGGMNGTLLINSKSPFKYKGLSFQAKQGIMHLQDPGQKPTPYYDWSMRYATTLKGDKFGFKISGQFVKATDWGANDLGDVRRTSIASKVVPGNRSTDPNYDGVNVYGDETTANMQSVAQSAVVVSINTILANLPPGFPAPPPVTSYAQAQAYLANPVFGPILGGVLSTNPQTAPFYLGLKNGVLPNQNVSRTGYNEKDLVDYNTLNFKATGGIFYKITPKVEASFNTYLGTGTTVYTGADRYSLKDLQMAQHKLEIRHPSWFLRGYTTQENAGNSYNATVLGRLINEDWKASTTWYPQYVAAYYNARMLGLSDYAAQQKAREFADVGRFMPGTNAFDTAAKSIRSKPIPQGAMFLDRSDLWAAEGQVNISDLGGFSNMIDVIAGVQWKEYVLNSQGTLFADSTGKLKPVETGGYVQLKKALFNDMLTITAAGRYDKHTNFEGRFTPRVTAVVKVAKVHNFRVSYQTGYRFPTNQDQYINLNVGSGYLIGGLPSFQSYYNLGANPGFTAESVNTYRTTGDSTKLQVSQFTAMKPESVASYEVGYKTLLGKKLFIDAYYYYSQFENFLGREAVVQPIATTHKSDLLNPNSSSSRNLSYAQNTDQKVKSQGWGVTMEWQMWRKFTLYGNVFSDELKDVPADFVSYFNAPKYRYNVGLRNENFYKNIGFNFVWKWQDTDYYEGTFVAGTLPAYGTVDGQISYRLPNIKSVVRVGGTNLGNHYYRSGYGSPYVGGLYYVSFGYNIF